MSEQDELVSQLLSSAKLLGLTGITPVILSKSGNVIIHLTPHPIVARVAAVLSEENSELAYYILERELRVAHHLQTSGVPVLLPIHNAGPHNVNGKWATFWNYVPLTQLEPLSPGHAVSLVNDLSLAMKSLSCSIPVLGVWERACQAAARLGEQSDPRIQALLEVFVKVDKQIRMISPEALIPAHGDAHAGNLLPSPEGWLWIDFEDVSLMPVYWDLASYVGNLVLFNGIQEPTYKYMLNNAEIVEDKKEFELALSARTLLSTLSNLDFALAGHGDMAFATRQLELAEPFLYHLNPNR